MHAPERLERYSPTLQSEFQQALADKYDHVPSYIPGSPLWTPLVHNHEAQMNFESLQSALQLGLMAILQAAPEDHRLRKLLVKRLDNPVRTLFFEQGEINLDSQFIRPDYIYDPNGDVRICEINTRFIFNGNIASVHMARFAADHFDVTTAAYDRMDDFTMQNYGKPGEKIGYVRGIEPEHDILMQRQRTPAKAVELKPKNIKRAFDDGIGQLVLELHQHELDRVKGDVAEFMKLGGKVLNHPAVVHLLHDKRLLVPLSDEEYMSSLVGWETAHVLASSVVPSFHPRWEGREPEVAGSKNLLAKPALSGKSEGQKIVRVATYWDSLKSPNMHVFQPRLTPPNTIDSPWPVEVAGTLPMTLGGEVFGPGIVRIGIRRHLRSFVGFSVAMEEAS